MHVWLWPYNSALSLQHSITQFGNFALCPKRTWLWYFHLNLLANNRCSGCLFYICSSKFSIFTPGSWPGGPPLSLVLHEVIKALVGTTTWHNWPILSLRNTKLSWFYYMPQSNIPLNKLGPQSQLSIDPVPWWWDSIPRSPLCDKSPCPQYVQYLMRLWL